MLSNRFVHMTLNEAPMRRLRLLRDLHVRFALTAVLCAAVLSVAPSVQAQTGLHRMIVVYRNGSIPGNAEQTAKLAGGRLVRRHELFGAAIVAGTAAVKAQLQSDPNVEYVVEDRVVTGSMLLRRALDSDTPTTVTPIHANLPRLLLPSDTSDTFYTGSPQGWAVRAVGGSGGNVADSGTTGPWVTTTGRGIRIAILDSGVDRNHPDIAPNLVLNLSEVDEEAQPSTCDDGSPQDQTGHGTWVASLAAGAAGNGTGRVVGVAPEASLLNIKVLQRIPGTGATAAAQCENGQASGLLSWVLQGIDDAVTQHADVIVLAMSVTLDLYSGDSAGVKAGFDRATHAAALAGVVLVASAGNDAIDLSNTRYVQIPAQSRDVLAVVASTNPACAQNVQQGATCAAGPVSVPYYSNFGAPLNAVGAPGGSYPDGSDEGISGWVRGACSSGLTNTADGLPTDANHSYGCFNLGHQGYVQAIGTSASAPLVAGVVALVRAAHPEWTANTVVAAVRSSAVPTPTMPYGVVDAAAAIAYQP
jgi:subtilisin family serine protease